MSRDKSNYQYVVTPNVDHIMKLQTDRKFLKIYESASLVLADGQPIIWAARYLNKPLKEKVSGSDLFPLVCGMAAREKLKVFFLGGQEGVAEEAARRLKAKYTELNVAGIYSPPFGFEKNVEENEKIIKLIVDAQPDILFVGLGAPKQEKWIYENLEKIRVPVSLGIGASFDFEAGIIQRAPAWMQKSGLEWFWRFSQEPKRLFRRYFVDDSKFLILLMKEKRKKN
ncbi:WecB/TagA/CpsF family glycosyltransferase [Planococcus glaciei]|uniref:WecB/TagA/CpsF family glycosyltransferase n=1 Tax=Planococcus glaciei TaxID=459472 RepID=UPI001F1B2DF8|nr:WecB/TagA/CpsF family glycosyltransferase [Planococcus glaciei]